MTFLEIPCVKTRTRL